MKKFISIICALIYIFSTISCQSKEKEKMKSFCLNVTNKKTSEDCKKCLSILDENKNNLNPTDYTNKKLQYFLLLKEYKEARKFINSQEFKYPQEKQIRLEEINLIESYCLNKDFENKKSNFLKYLEEEIMTSKNIEIVNLLKGEKSNIQSNLVVEYFCNK